MFGCRGETYALFRSIALIINDFVNQNVLMKQIDDLLNTMGRRGFYCSKLITIFWEQSPRLTYQSKYTSLYFALPFVTLFMWLDFQPLNVTNQANPIESCSEFTFQSNGQNANLSLPKFDPALGTLRSVEIMTESMIVADVTEKEVKGSNYALVLSVDLSAQLPNQAKKVHQSSSRFNKSTRDEALQKSGFSETFKDAKQSTEVITTDLDAFVGTGNLDIPLSVDGLINFKDEVSSITSHLKTKVCIKYNYE